MSDGRTRDVPGVDARSLERWIRDRGLGLQPPLEISALVGGASNLTYRVEDAAGRTVVLRRPPLRGVLPGAHDMAREHRIITALGPTAVPVPSPVALCEDDNVIGAPFYVMEFVDGVALRDAAGVARTVPETARRVVADALVDTLVALHAVDPERVGLGTLGRRDEYIARQLRTWDRQWRATTRTRGVPVVEEVHRRLLRDIPAQQGSGVTHGDYRLDNVLVDDRWRIAAVLDWELCTLGDPLADLGLLLVYWSDPGDEFTALPDAPTAAGGFPRRAELAERYARTSDRDLSDLAYYVAFGYWKLAVVLAGVHARMLTGAYGDASHAGGYGERVQLLAATALDTIAGSGR